MDLPVSRFSGDFAVRRPRPAEPDPERTADRTFEQMVVQSQPQIRAYVLSLVLNWADADEILQETYVRLYEQRDEWDRLRSFGAWARTIAYYQVLSHRKRVQRERVHFSKVLVDTVADRHEDEFERFEARKRALRACHDGLSASSRRLVDLVYCGDRTIRQVADEMGRTIASTYKAVARIRRSLYDCVERALRKESPE